MCCCCKLREITSTLNPGCTVSRVVIYSQTEKIWIGIIFRKPRSLIINSYVIIILRDALPRLSKNFNNTTIMNRYIIDRTIIFNILICYHSIKVG